MTAKSRGMASYMSIQYIRKYDWNMSCSLCNELNACAQCVLAKCRIGDSGVGHTVIVKGLHSMKVDGPPK